MKRTIVLAMALVASGLAFGQEMLSDDILGVKAETFFKVKFISRPENPYVVAFSMGGGLLGSNDTVQIAPANEDASFEFIYDDEEPLDLSISSCEFWITKEEMQMFIDNGLEYVSINEQVYWLDKKSIRLSQELAAKTFN